MTSITGAKSRARFAATILFIAAISPRAAAAKAIAQIAAPLIFLAASSCVQVEIARPSFSSWAADEAAIRAATTASADAWNRGDLKGHVAIYVDSVTFMTRTGPRPGVDAIVQSFTTTYFRDGLPKQQLRFEQTTIRRLDANSALETGRFILSGGGEPEQSGWFTLVWVRTPSGWKAVHDHSS